MTIAVAAGKVARRAVAAGVVADFLMAHFCFFGSFKVYIGQLRDFWSVGMCLLLSLVVVCL